jgi:FkbM family methyltransferase
VVDDLDAASVLELVQLDESLTCYVSSRKEAAWQYDEIFKRGCYDQIRLARHALVFDVGANIGLFTLFAKRRSPDARVVAFEPMPISVAAFRCNADLHNLTHTTMHECALGRRAERDVTFTYYPTFPGNSTRFPEDKELQKQVALRETSIEYVQRNYACHTVAATVQRLSSFLPDGQVVDLLKIDVEGAELDVLLGVDHAHWNNIDQVIVEVQDLRGRLRDVRELLAARGLSSVVMPAPKIPPEVRTYVVYAARE